MDLAKIVDEKETGSTTIPALSKFANVCEGKYVLTINRNPRGNAARREMDRILDMLFNDDFNGDLQLSSGSVDSDGEGGYAATLRFNTNDMRDIGCCDDTLVLLIENAVFKDYKF